uniref:Stress up-regulated Nod 19 protein n=1 Tax=Salix viminalis TaxID=40686 RepID=A0A6N2N0U4_SALVM
MALRSQGGLFLPSMVVLTLAFAVSCTIASPRIENKIKSVTFLSPEFVLEPGSVENRFYYNIDFPRGHVALKSFRAEVVDDAGKSIPLHETYLHHWLVGKYYQRQDMAENDGDQKIQPENYIFGGNSGICQGTTLRQYFGLGSETRKTDTHIPDPYAIEIGNPAEIPEGYEEKWMINVHAIDTRGAVDRLGCTECRCELYNVTVDEDGQTLRPGYKGGISCCYDQTRCKVRKGYEGARRSLYLRYTVEWIDWDCGIIPVKVFIFDVTDTGKRLNVSIGSSPEIGCQVEFDVASCNTGSAVSDGCVDVRRTSLTMPVGGSVIYGVAHQHTGGIGSTLYGEDGRVICNSEPIYGQGKDAGDEAGYIVGMSTCYPEPGSIQITAGENLVLESNYSSTQKHIGVMGLFYILVADRTPNPTNFWNSPIHIHEKITVSKSSLAVVSLLGLAVVGAGLSYRQKKGREEEGYEPIMA